MQRRILLAATLGLASLAWGQGGRGRGAQQAGAQAAPQATPTANSSAPDFYNYDSHASSTSIADAPRAESHQKISLNGEPLAYTTRAGFLALRNATTGVSEAHLFYTSYSKDGVNDPSARPLLMFFGGAPGMAAAWQEFGGLGPKRVRLDTGAWSENPHTLLGMTDLVFVNPVGTGFSRADQPNRAESFFSSANDVASLAEFVRAYLNQMGRRGSPLYLAGEDRGTGRVAGLASYLCDHDVAVRGVVLLNMAPSADATAGDAESLTLLPSLVMSAWVHKKLSPDLNSMSAEQIAGQARQFASREYLHALYKGDRMSAEERAKAIADLARLTGLSKAFVASNDLRIPLDRFGGELMREQHGALSSSDARVTGFAPTLGGGGRGGGGFGGPPPPPIDFNLRAVSGPFLNAYESYLRQELEFKGVTDGIYYLDHGGVGAFTPASDDASLASAFARNPGMRLFVGINYYDLAAPFYAEEFTLGHLSVSSEVRAHNITVSYYEAGGMTYLDDKEIAKLQRDLTNFITRK
jgi:carboxypeptidase C (cathepsin A)